MVQFHQGALVGVGVTDVMIAKAEDVSDNAHIGV